MKITKSCLNCKITFETKPKMLREQIASLKAQLEAKK